MIRSTYLDTIWRRFADIDVNVRLHILHFRVSSDVVALPLFHSENKTNQKNSTQIFESIVF